MTSANIVPKAFIDMLSLADPSWRPVLRQGLEAVAARDSAYLPALAEDEYLPTDGRLFAAFAQPLDEVRYVLVGEGPYPRPESATGFCFMDGAVESLWSEKGLSKQVNRATSLRNFMKMLLVAEGMLDRNLASSEQMPRISLRARAIGSSFIQTRSELQRNLLSEGFLLLNAALVFRPHVPPVKDARAWQPFLQVVLDALADRAERSGHEAPRLVLWGKIAEQLKDLPPTARFPKAVAEHPYNLSFVDNAAMQSLFGPMHLLIRKEARRSAA